MKNIESIGGVEFVRKHPEMFCSTRGPSADEIASRVAQSALVLGAKKVLVEQCNDWWVVRSDLDWLTYQAQVPATIEQLFQNIVAFPEAGQNWHRPEIEIGAFAKIAFVQTATKAQLIFGDADSFSDVKAVEWNNEFVRALAFVI